MLRMKTYVCVKCSRPFQKYTGGVVANRDDFELAVRPICDSCKRSDAEKYVRKIFDWLR